MRPITLPEPFRTLFHLPFCAAGAGIVVLPAHSAMARIPRSEARAEEALAA